jgi:type IV pilus assembly protein PilV
MTHDAIPSRPTRARRWQAGFTLIEVLVTFVILVVGLLGLIGLQARSQQAELESFQRGQGLVYVQDMIDRMNANRTDSKNQSYVTANPVGAVGTPPVALNDCTGLVGAALDLCDWSNQLIGASEANSAGACSTTSGAGCAGAMVGAQGCISYDVTTELLDSLGVAIPGTGIQTIQLWWQGTAPTGQSLGVTCGTNVLAGDARRRMVTATLRMGGLTAE